MSILLAILRTLAVFISYSGFALAGAVLQCFLFLSTTTRHRLIAAFTRHWARTSCWIFNIQVKVEGDAHIAPGCLIVSNHVGSPDIFVMGACFPAFFVSKAEVADWPLFNLMARLGESIFAERSQRHQVKEVIGRMRERLQERCSVILFPEGQATDGADLLAFKPSTFEAAVLAQSPVVPVTILYHDRHRPSIACWYDMSFMRHIWRLLKNSRLPVTVVVHAAIAGEPDRRVLAEKSRAIIRDRYLKHRGQTRPA